MAKGFETKIKDRWIGHLIFSNELPSGRRRWNEENSLQWKLGVGEKASERATTIVGRESNGCKEKSEDLLINFDH